DSHLQSSLSKTALHKRHAPRRGEIDSEFRQPLINMRPAILAGFPDAVIRLSNLDYTRNVIIRRFTGSLVVLTRPVRVKFTHSYRPGLIIHRQPSLPLEQAHSGFSVRPEDTVTVNG